ncbi:expressed unknown protein [Seminavis robusta]|uniref:Apple domain-containing protein n=1 Tax=Seminavis robusta TaxID=568900 RepID=A0A9N8E527_9STRA|nr:expressed unknown protein [Seminavis robusta]|eukprot:Sro551_g164810.1 n/a (1684) ;mRNA; f:7515-13813
MVLDGCTLQSGVEIKSLSGNLRVTSSIIEAIDISVEQGTAEFSYGKMEALQSLSNEGSLFFQSMEVASSEFAFYSGSGSFSLADAQGMYSLADSGVLETYCSSSSATDVQPQLTKVKDLQECQDQCDANDKCRATRCGIHSIGTRFLPSSNTKGPNYTSSPVNGRCRGWCYTLSFCNAYTFDPVTKLCTFYDNAAVTQCNDSPENALVVDTNHNDALGRFVELPAGLCYPEDDNRELTSIGQGVQTWLATAADCSALCGALAECSAFEIDSVSSRCRYFSWDAEVQVSSNCTGKAFMSVQDSSFPLGLSSSVMRFDCSAEPSLSQLKVNSGGPKVCETLCHTNPLCLAYTYQGSSAGTPDCFLWSDTSYLDWLLNPERCEASFGETYLITKRVDFVQNDDMILPCDMESPLDAVEDAITPDNCKAVCLRTVGCSTFTFSLEDGCRLTCPATNEATGSNQTVPRAFEKKEINVELGYVNYVGVTTCINARHLPDRKLYTAVSESTCRYLCDLADSCMGYFAKTFSTGARKCSFFEYVETRECEPNEKPRYRNLAFQGGDKVVSTNGLASDPYVMSKVPVNPFVKVQSSETVCPDSNALMLTQAGIWDAEACQSLCLSHTHCSIVHHDSATGICHLYDSESFLQSDCAQQPTSESSLYVSYLQFLFRDSISFASFGASQGETKTLCVSGESPAATVTDIPSEAGCAFLCEETQPDCNAYTYDEGEKTCELHRNDFELSKCASRSTVLGVSYKRMRFRDLEDEECLSGQANLINGYSGIHDYPECAALCEASSGCQAFKVEGTDCALYDTSETGSCPGLGASEKSFVLFSEKLYTGLGHAYCPAFNTPKQLCDDTTRCESIQHRVDGVLVAEDEDKCGLGEVCDIEQDCQSPLVCQHASTRNADLGTVAKGEAESTPKKFCVLSDVSADESDCEETCLANPQCVGIYRQGSACLELRSEDLNRVEPSTHCSQDSVALLPVKFRENPYQEKEKACLNKPLNMGPFVQTELADCINICNSFSPCQHFTHSADGTCSLFASQVGDVGEDCALPQGVTAYVNTRSFVQEIEFMGVPERVFAQVHALSYDECAASCRRLDQCLAFIHESGCRQSGALADAVVKPERLVRLTPNGNFRVVTLNFDSTTDQLEVLAREDLSVGNFHDQVLAIEEFETEGRARIRFQRGDVCLDGVAGQFVEAIPCADRDAQNFLITNRSDGAFPISQTGGTLTTDTGCLFANEDGKMRFDISGCTSINLASRPVRLSPGDAKGLCLTSQGSGSSGTIGLAPCDPSDENQKFTYLFGTKRWIQQKKAFELQLGGSSQCSGTRLWLRRYSSNLMTDLFQQESGTLVVAGSCFNEPGQGNLIEDMRGDWVDCQARCNDLEECICFEYCPPGRQCDHARDNGDVRDGLPFTHVDQCLEYAPNNAGTVELRLGPCSPNDAGKSDVGSQNTIKFGEDCMALSQDNASGESNVVMVPCDSDDPLQKWHQDALCQLTTRESTPPFKLESAFEEGRCLAMDRNIFDDSDCGRENSITYRGGAPAGTAHCDTADASVFQYHYKQSKKKPLRLAQAFAGSKGKRARPSCVVRETQPTENDNFEEVSLKWGRCHPSPNRNMWAIKNFLTGSIFQSAIADDETAVKVLMFPSLVATKKLLQRMPLQILCLRLGRSMRWEIPQLSFHQAKCDDPGDH